MAERSPFFSAKTDNQKIGYVEGNDAFDLLGNRRCNYSLNTGNLLELDSGRIVGHVSLAGYFVGASWIANELFPQSDANAALTGQINEPASAAYAAPATSSDEPAAADQTTLATSSDEPAAAAYAAPPTPSSDEPAAADQTTLATSSDEPAAAAYAAPTSSSDEPAAADLTETLLSNETELALEMIRITLAMNSVGSRRQTTNDVAMRMREHSRACEGSVCEPGWLRLPAAPARL